MTTNNAINAPIPFALSQGGTAANLTASNGGIFYSTASAGAILAGTATANQLLVSGSSTTPAWTTSTYPTTNAINTLLYASSANTMAALATGNNGVLITSSGGVPSISSTLPAAVQGNITTLGTITSGVWNGTAITVANGGTGNTTFTAYSVICAGTTAQGIFQNVSGVGSAGQVLTSNGASALPTWQSNVASTWIAQATSITMAVNTSYISTNASLNTFTLPATAAVGSEFAVAGNGAGGWKIGQAASQQINFGNVTTTSGTGGSLQSTNAFDVVFLVCTVANTQFSVINTVGNITYV